MAKSNLCAVEGCGKNTFSAIHCRNHHHRFRKYGDPLGGPTSNGEPLRWLADHAHYDEEDCLIWPFARRDGQYGRLHAPDSRRQVYAHRLMCEAANGPPPSPQHEAAHSCGNGYGGCVNPKHLRWDTVAGNASDRELHGTENIGERNGQSKLTATDVRMIRTLLPNFSHVEIAALFKVSRPAISDIASGKRWSKTV